MGEKGGRGRIRDRFFFLAIRSPAARAATTLTGPPEFRTLFPGKERTG